MLGVRATILRTSDTTAELIRNDQAAEVGADGEEAVSNRLVDSVLHLRRTFPEVFGQCTRAVEGVSVASVIRVGQGI